jgi:hypothetical protein
LATSRQHPYSGLLRNDAPIVICVGTSRLYLHPTARHLIWQISSPENIRRFIFVVEQHHASPIGIDPDHACYQSIVAVLAIRGNEDQFYYIVCFEVSRSHLYENTLDVHISGSVAPKESFSLKNLNGEMQR